MGSNIHHKHKHIIVTLVTEFKGLDSVEVTISSNRIPKDPSSLSLFLPALQLIRFCESQFSGIKLQETYSFLQLYYLLAQFLEPAHPM